MFMGYSLVPFCLFTWDKWMKVFINLKHTVQATNPFYPCLPFCVVLDVCLLTLNPFSLQVYKSIYFLGHVLFFTLLLVLPYIRKLLVPRKEKLKKAE